MNQCEAGEKGRMETSGWLIIYFELLTSRRMTFRVRPEGKRFPGRAIGKVVWEFGCALSEGGLRRITCTIYAALIAILLPGGWMANLDSQFNNIVCSPFDDQCLAGALQP